MGKTYSAGIVVEHVFNHANIHSGMFVKLYLRVLKDCYYCILYSTSETSKRVNSTIMTTASTKSYSASGGST